MFKSKFWEYALYVLFVLNMVLALVHHEWVEAFLWGFITFQTFMINALYRWLDDAHQTTQDVIKLNDEILTLWRKSYE